MGFFNHTADIASFLRSFGVEGLQSHQSGEGRGRRRTMESLMLFARGLAVVLWLSRWEPSPGPATVACCICVMAATRAFC